jgi:hypothetical protein
VYLQKRPSGGRGEYEIAGSFGGYDVHDLLNHDLLLDVGSYGTRPTGVRVIPQGGKPRLRLTGNPPGIHLHRQVQAILLLPKPTRDEASVGTGTPVMRENEYILRRMDVTGLAVSTIPPRATLDLGEFIAENGSGASRNAAHVDFPGRLQRIEQIVAARNQFPQPIRDLLTEWDAALRTPGPLGAGAEARVTRIMAELEAQAANLGIAYSAGADVLPALEQVLGGPAQAQPGPAPNAAVPQLPVAPKPPLGPAGPLPSLGQAIALNSGVGGTLAIASDLVTLGWAVAYRGNQPGVGYDLEATKPGAMLRVEVKSSIGLTTPELSESEWAEAQKDGDTYVLAIVDYYATPLQTITYVRNPALAPHTERTVVVYRIPRAGLAARQIAPQSL